MFYFLKVAEYCIDVHDTLKVFVLVEDTKFENEDGNEIMAQFSCDTCIGGLLMDSQNRFAEFDIKCFKTGLIKGTVIVTIYVKYVFY